MPPNDPNPQPHLSKHKRSPPNQNCTPQPSNGREGLERLRFRYAPDSCSPGLHHPNPASDQHRWCASEGLPHPRPGTGNWPAGTCSGRKGAVERPLFALPRHTPLTPASATPKTSALHPEAHNQRTRLYLAQTILETKATPCGTPCPHLPELQARVVRMSHVAYIFYTRFGLSPRLSRNRTGKHCGNTVETMCKTQLGWPFKTGQYEFATFSSPQNGPSAGSVCLSVNWLFSEPYQGGRPACGLEVQKVVRIDVAAP